MSESRIEPEKITKPIQLVAAWFVALIVLVASFLSAAKTVDQPLWLPVLFGFAAVSFVPLFATLVFRLQTKYRPELQEDRYYAKYRSDKRQLAGFTPENLPGAALPAGTTFTKADGDGDLKQFRQDVYDRQRGLFLVHVWRPSTVPGQIADISLRLHEHGKVWKPLTDHLVERVDYYLGEYFFGGNIVSKTNAAENFRFDVSAYGTSCWVAKIYFNDGTQPDLLERYIDFPL
jgi:hypothetical protein